jgi:hypothetical protein
MHENQLCANCDNTFSGEFCNKCGQKVNHRITMGHIGHELVHVFTHADKGFFHLLIQLFIKPGTVAREYIVEGKRKRYFMPFQYIFIIAALAAFVAANAHFIEATSEAIGNTAAYSAKQMAFVQKTSALQTKYYNFIILLQLPFYALATFIVYRKYRFNYAEHLTLQTFVTAQTTVISMLIMLLIFLTGKSALSISVIMSLITIAFQIFAYTQFYREKSFKGILRALLANILALIFFMIFIIIAVIIFGIATNAFSK